MFLNSQPLSPSLHKKRKTFYLPPSSLSPCLLLPLNLTWPCVRHAPSSSCALASPTIAHLSLRHMHVSSLPTTRNSLIHVLIMTSQNLDGFDPLGGRWVYRSTHRPHRPGGRTRAAVDLAPTQFFPLIRARRKEKERAFTPATLYSAHQGGEGRNASTGLDRSIHGHLYTCSTTNE